MATVNCSNRKDSQALNGQAATVTLNGAESLSVMPLLQVGQSCLIESSNKTTYIESIDTYGHSFKIKPAQLNLRADSSTTGKLKNSELITVTY